MAAEKKKTFTALCLIALMVFMWAKVLNRKTPKTAAAALKQNGLNQDTTETDSQLKISYIQLPEVAGRNDLLTRDFFAADGWKNFIDGKGVGIDEVNVVSKDGNEEVMRRVAKILKLEAIGLDESPQAFINNKLLSVGDRFLVRDGVNKYECEVVRIQENVVVIKCGEAEITLKLAQAIEMAD
ncbi:MAG: hypothetical protein FVQ85_13965 [Planctomycetes bacterium]|nr:hypothetical protein [Planctomycetota bacterium]